MSIFIATYTALRYLERPDALRTPAPVDSLESSECSLNALAEREDSMRRLGLNGSPVHLLMGERNRTSDSDWYERHFWAETLPPDSFVCPVPGIYVSTPEFCFLQMARSLPRIALIRFGYELAATYRLDPQCERGFEERPPLTTRQQLANYLAQADDSPYARKARKALEWVADGSASPRETALAMMLSLPSELGGCEAGLPELNYEVAVRREDGVGRRRIDLYWPEQRFGIEYDSDQEHASAEGIARDSYREKEIELQGVTLARVTNAELKTERGRELLFRTVRRGLGKGYREPAGRTKYVRRRLASLLLAPHWQMLPEPALT